ncbi:hypothetical protein AGMMS49942_01690 [Spirochaetia bacterium]|nr:hypothetical protein AGMMS49942_01690 [Spirochaetia bacterium]
MQAALNSAAPVVFAGLKVDGVVLIPAGKTVALVDNPAIDAVSSAPSSLTLIVAGGVSGEGVIGSASTLLVQRTAIAAKNIAGSTVSVVAAAPASGAIPASAITGTNVALIGPITVKTGASGAGEVLPTDLSTKNVFVIGNLTVNNVPTPTSLHVSGNATISVAFTIDTLTVGGTADITNTLANAGSGKYYFNGLTTTGALTTGAALEIGGAGKVTIASLTGTNHLTLTNTNPAGVTITGASTLAGSKTIDASASKVVFGTGTDSVTITKGLLKSNAAGLISVNVNGQVLVPYSSNAASLELLGTGTIVTKGTGKVIVSGGLLELGGSGTNTFTAVGEKITITAATASAIIDASAGTSHVAGDGLILGTNAFTNLSLLSYGSPSTTATFTAAGANKVKLLTDTIIIGATNGSLQLGVTANLSIGTGSGAIGIGASGALGMSGSGGKISGVHSGETTYFNGAQTGATLKGTVAGTNYDTGLTFANSNIALSGGVITASGTQASAITGSSANGGKLDKTSVCGS